MALQNSVVVNITDATQQSLETQFNLVLIISDEAGVDEGYTEYNLAQGIDASGIATDYAVTTNTYKKANVISQQVNSTGSKVTKVAVYPVGAGDDTLTGAALTTKLNELIGVNDSFFRVITTIEASSDKLAIAMWAETNKKIAYLQYANTTFTEDYSNVKARLLLHTAVDEHLDAAEAGRFSTQNPGTLIAKFKNYQSVTGSALTQTNITDAEAKNIGYYIQYQGTARQGNSLSSNGNYSDVIEAIIFIEITLQNAIFNLLTSKDKLTTDLNGLQLIKSVLAQELLNFQDQEIISSFGVDISNATFDSTTRKYTGITFSATYLHGAEIIDISGVLS